MRTPAGKNKNMDAISSFFLMVGNMSNIEISLYAIPFVMVCGVIAAFIFVGSGGDYGDVDYSQHAIDYYYEEKKRRTQ